MKFLRINESFNFLNLKTLSHLYISNNIMQMFPAIKKIIVKVVNISDKLPMKKCKQLKKK